MRFSALFIVAAFFMVAYIVGYFAAHEAHALPVAGPVIQAGR